MARIALDIDSTLHHYWDLLDSIARERFGVELPYEEQRDWGITGLERADLIAAIEETHSEENILAAEPYPGAVDVVRSWHEAGHFIQITSHRHDGAHGATARWLERIGLPYDELYCSDDKLARCREIGIELLIDDSPVNLLGAVDAGIAAATISHPWNREICEEEDIVCAPDWPELARRLAPLLEGARA